MATENFEKAGEIFEHAIEIEDPAERERYLDGACKGNPKLRAEVEVLLKAHEEAGEFLEVPHLAVGVTYDATPLPEMAGAIVDRYKLLEKIGEGGMAVVYLAEQQKPVRRRVALKIIKLGMDTRSVIARFEAERQALAMMDHPNIAKVLDAGTTDTGRPYFVMELVRGISITEYCDKNNLNTKERLALFSQVCSAVQHAHQKGIIHRDIKPANVMVTLQDSRPVPMVIDFGIAKATNQQLTEKTLFTRYAHMIGTPGYMSPEQAEMGRLDVDTRSDIYSLGVLLYELLTGTLPLDAEKLREAGYAEIQRVIREEEPDKPSTRLSTMGEALTEVAKRRKANPESLTKLVRGDLDWIVMRSLEKDRTRRYDTAAELAADIERYFRNEPVLARSPAVSYRFYKFVRRHRVSASAAALIAMALGTGLIMMVYGLMQARQQRDRAVAAEANAVRQQEEAERQRELALEQQQTAEKALEKEAAAHKEAEEALYLNRINLAAKYFHENNIKPVHELLSACPSELRAWEWYYLWHASYQSQMTLRGHEDQVRSVAFSPDGNRIVSGGIDNTLKLWDARKGNELRTLRGHSSAIWCVAFSPDGKRIASGDSDGILKIWDVDAGSELNTLHGHERGVWSVAFSPDGRRIVSGGGDGLVKVRDADSGTELKILPGHKNLILSVAFSPDGRWIAFDSGDGTIKIFDVDSGNEFRTLHGHVAAVTCVAFSPDGGQLVSGSGDNTVRVWDANDGSELRIFSGHRGTVWSVGFSPNGRRIVSGSFDETLKVWDIARDREVMTLRGHEDQVRSVAFSPDGKRIISSSFDGTLKLWDVERHSVTLAGHKSRIFSIAFSPDGRWIATASGDGTVKVWDARDGSEVRTLGEHGSPVWCVAFSPDGSQIASGGWDRTIKIRDTSSGNELRALPGHEGAVTCVVFSPDGRRLVSASLDKTIRVWEVNSDSVSRILHRGEYGVSSVAFSPDGRWIVSGGGDGVLRIWNIDTGTELKTRPGQLKAGILSVAFSPGGKLIVSGDKNNTIKVWDTDSDKEPISLRGHRGPVNCVVFSPDGRRIVSGSYDNTLRVWNAKSGGELLALQGDEAGRSIWSVAFSPDGRRIVSGSSDGTLKVWDTIDPSAIEPSMGIYDEHRDEDVGERS